MVGAIFLAGCGGLSFKQNLAVGEFVGSATGIGDGFTTWMDVDINRQGKIEGWGDIGIDERPTTISGTIAEDGKIILNIVEDGSGSVHVLTGTMKFELVSMSGEVNRSDGGRARLELVRIDPL